MTKEEIEKQIAELEKQLEQVTDENQRRIIEDEIWILKGRLELKS